MLDIIQSKENIAILNEYARHGHGFVVLAGKNGRGKTYAARQIGKAVMELNDRTGEHYNFIIIKYSDLHEKWIKGFREDCLFDRDMYKNARFLVIDDFGSNKEPSPSFSDMLYAVIDYRYTISDKVGTVLTTNLNVAEMRAGFGDAITSRATSNLCMRFDMGGDRRFKGVMESLINSHKQA